MPTDAAMSAPMLAVFLRRIRLTRRVPALQALAHEIALRFPDDEATPQLLGVIVLSAMRLAGARESRELEA